MSGEVDALVTAPISKEWMNRAGHHFPGHRELLAHLSRTRLWRMMFAGGELTVALVTVHMGLARVATALTQRNVFDTIRLLVDAFARRTRAYARPRIAVLGFNPHAGESGMFGDEEIRVIAPAIRRAQSRGHRCVRSARARHRVHPQDGHVSISTRRLRCITIRA